MFIFFDKNSHYNHQLINNLKQNTSIKIQSFISLSIFMLVLTLFVSGCNKNENEAIESTTKSIIGSSDLLAELSYLSTVETKSGEISES